jgi:uncharacterized membrane protein YgcG
MIRLVDRLAAPRRPRLHLSIIGLLLGGGLFLALFVPAGRAAGPPYPPPVTGQRVYDTAGVFDPETIAAAEATIQGIEARTGAEVVVYSQVVGDDVTTDQAESDAQALMDQWGVGRKGFDDGLVILFDLEPGKCHGQVQLYAGPGYRAAYLSNDQRDAIFNDDMTPELEDCDLPGALTAGLKDVDDAATPANAEALSRARITNALFGLVIAPLIFLLAVGSAAYAWWRRGRDAIYTDDPSVYMPAPPPDLTPSSAALVYDGRSSRRALTTAMLDLANRGQIEFDVPDPGKPRELAIVTEVPPSNDSAVEAARTRASRQPLIDAESYALVMLQGLAGAAGRIEHDELTGFGQYTAGFDSRLEAYAVEQGWFVEAPAKATSRYATRGALEIGAGIAAWFVLGLFPISGLAFIGVALGAAGVVSLFIAREMPARTKNGAMIDAQLKAYRRTLQATMAEARTMDEVVQASKLAWVDSPDQAVVWGVALDLNQDVQAVLGRTVEDARRGASARGAYFPAWYGSGGTPFTAGSAGSAGTGGAGLFSSGPIPDVGGMMAALGTIGNSPASSGGGGGGFGGGGSGGGGGGAGGGF